jgi:VanZ family protein/phosphoribosyl-ATP pyrophosphohydrolase
MKKFFAKFNFFISYIIPVILMAGIIFYFSAQSGLGAMKNNIVEIFLRKSAHFVEYGLLSFFVWRLFYYGYRFFPRVSFWFSFILVGVYAISDEGHQFFVENRSGKVVDVVIDLLSAFVMLQIINFFIEQRKKYLIWLFIALAFLGSIVGLLILEVRESEWKIEGGSNNNQIELNAKVELNEINTKKDKVIHTEISKQKNNSNISKDKLTSSQKKQNKIILPKKIIQKVPFTMQSPFAKWDQLHEEACEEASLIMLKYHNDKKELTKQIAEEEIQKLVKYQLKEYGDFYDTDVKITKEIGEKFYHLNGLKIIQDFTIQDLKNELAQRNIILIPTAGRELHNPNFTPPGPLYHNLVIIGYDDTATTDSTGRKTEGVFVTNDPGTRKGEGYKYDQRVLYKAIHDFPSDKNKILTSKKRALVLIERGL